MCNETCDIVLRNSCKCGVTKEQTKSGNEVDKVDKIVDIVDKVVDNAGNIVDNVNIKNEDFCGHCRQDCGHWLHQKQLHLKTL